MHSIPYLSLGEGGPHSGEKGPSETLFDLSAQKLTVSATRGYLPPKESPTYFTSSIHPDEFQFARIIGTKSVIR